MDQYSDKAFVNRNLKPFNLQEALAGKPVVTRDGRKVVRIAHFPESKQYTVAGLLKGEDSPRTFMDTGKYVSWEEEKDTDLFMASEKKEGWIGIGQGRKYVEKIAFVTHAYGTEQEARDQFIKDSGYTPQAVIKISWEEE